MSYEKAMRWQRKHPKGTRQPVLMHTNSGFWPSGSYLFDSYFPYRELCEKAGLEPIECKAFYDGMVGLRTTDPKAIDPRLA